MKIRLYATPTKIVALIGCVLLTLPLAAAQDDIQSLEESAIKTAIQRAAQSVVRIETFGGMERVGQRLVADGPTTGVVVSEDGFVVSSAFNFAQKPSSILVRLPSGKRAASEIVARDKSRKLVLLKVNTDEKLTVTESVPRDEMVVGQWAIALGCAYDVEKLNISVGVISARSRIWGKAIQTDAKISPSNYGGPLIDIRGRIFGILVPLSPTDQDAMAGAQWYDSGIGFAVPLTEITPHLDKMKNGEDLMTGILGIALKGKDIYANAAEIAAVQPKSPAYKAGLEAGDKIVAADGEKIVRQAQLKHALGRRYAGDEVELVALRDEQEVRATVVLADKLEPYEHPFLGILPLRGPEKRTGIGIRFVYADSAAAKAGISAGDELLEIAGKEVGDIDAAIAVLGNHEPGHSVSIRFEHKGESVQKDVVLDGLPEQTPDSLPPARPAISERPEPRPATGVVDIKIPEAKNECVAYVPEGYHRMVDYGLVVWLHAPGELKRNALVARWKTLCDDNDLILLAPQSADPSRWTAIELEFIRKTIDEVTDKYRVDPHRIVAIGEKAGAAMAMLVAATQHRDLVRGVVAVDAAMPGRASVPANDPIERLAIRIIYAKDSPLAERIQSNIEAFTTAKYPIATTVLDGGKAELKDDDLPGIARWIDTLDRL